MIKKSTLRKEVHLEPEVVNRLQELAAKKKWSLKLYMETVLISISEKANKEKA